MIEGSDGDVWTALYGACAAWLSGFVFLLGLVGKVASDASKSRARIWEKLDDQNQDGTLLAVEKRFVNKEDLDRLEKRLNESMRAMFREHEINIQNDIERRMRMLPK